MKTISTIFFLEQNPRMSVEQFINDSLHSIVGISDRDICQYVHALAKKAKSPADLVEKFRETGDFPISPAIQTFASDLMSRMPRVSAPIRQRGPTAQELAEQELKRLNRAVGVIGDDFGGGGSSRLVVFLIFANFPLKKNLFQF